MGCSRAEGMVLLLDDHGRLFVLETCGWTTIREPRAASRKKASHWKMGDFFRWRRLRILVQS
jgi:hypothetical protein